MTRQALDLVQTTLLGEAAEHAPFAILVADESMRYLAVNRAACELLGYRREEILEMHVPDVARDEDAPDLYAELVRTGELSGEMVLTRKDGTRVEVDFTAVRTMVAGMPVYISFARPAA